MSFFITFEGIEGSGKTTQLQYLENHLTGLGYQVVSTREPGGCSIADSIRALLLDPGNNRMIPRAELLLYSAARAQHVAEVIQPALSHGKIVLCDRFSDATTVYQGIGRGLDTEQLAVINRFAANDLVPDMTILLDYPAELGLQRARQRNLENKQEIESRFEMESLDFHKKIRQGYLDLAADKKRSHVIDADGPRDVVASRIAALVDRFLDMGKPA